MLKKPGRILSREAIAGCRKDFCELCGRPAAGEPHHARPRSLGGSDIRENLIQLCFDCHRGAHDGDISYLALVGVIAKRENLSPEDVCVRIGWPVPDGEPIDVPGVPSASGKTLDELIQAYITFQESEDDARWAKGAVCLTLTDGMGVSAGRVASWFGCSAAQVRELAKTFRAFPEESMRVPSLDFVHHKIAANTPEPEKWIAEAADNGWSTRQLRERIAVAYGKVSSKDQARAKAEKALLLAKEVFAEGGEVAGWLRGELLELVMPVKAASGL